MIPRGRGGNFTPYNLITLCNYCHSHAHGRPLYETDVTAADIAQYCLEYVSDYYAEDPDFFPLKSLKRDESLTFSKRSCKLARNIRYIHRETFVQDATL